MVTKGCHVAAGLAAIVLIVVFFLIICRISVAAIQDSPHYVFLKEANIIALWAHSYMGNNQKKVVLMN